MRRNVLFCYSRLPSFTNAVRDYVCAFADYSEHQIHYYDMDSGPLEFDLSPYDCIIFNYCFWARCLNVAPAVRKRIASYDGLKVAILQDEYDYFLWHERTLIDIGVQTIVTCVPPEHWGDVFRDPAFRKVEFVNALTGYVPQGLLELPPPLPLTQRQWTIGYRSRPVPFAYGRLTQEKRIIGERMKQICAEREVLANIEVSEESRIYGKAWPEFIGNCRTVLGTESGSNVFDFDGTLKPTIESYLEQHPGADFDTVHARFLSGSDGKIRMNQVSPRIFEAIALRTGLILFEGDYSGVVQPWDHYIPLRKDFSNVDQVLAAVADVSSLDAMTGRAHEAVIASGKYHFRQFVQRIDKHITARTPQVKGYEPVLGVVGWRTGNQEPLQPNRGQSLRLPTGSPLQHGDLITDPVVRFQFDAGALHRALMHKYESVLYSSLGKRLRAALRMSPHMYGVVRRCVRLLTFRR